MKQLINECGYGGQKSDFPYDEVYVRGHTYFLNGFCDAC